MRLATDRLLTDSLRFFRRTTAWFKQRKSIFFPSLKHYKRLPALSFMVVIALSGCGSNGGSGAAVATGATIGGSAIKGPLDCRAQGSVIATGSAGKTATGSTPSVGSFSADMTGLTFPVTVVVSGCMDTITGASQEFDLSTMVMDPTQTVINATPLSTLAVAAANVAKVGGGAITQADLDAATATVLNAFGLSASLANPLTGAFKTAAEVTNLAVASEAVAEVIKRSATAAPGGASTANIVASFAADLADGALDGATLAGVTIPVSIATAGGVNGNLIAKVFDEVAAGQLVISQVDPLTGVVMNVLPLSAFTNAVAALATATSGSVVTAASINPAATPIAVNVRPAAIPVIALTGANPLTVVLGSVFTDPGSTVTDNVDTGLIATVTGAVNTATVGTYTLTYNVSDAAGNAATVTRTVNVTDQTAPVIALTGVNPLTVALGTVFTDPGSTVTDNVDTGLIATVTGTVNTAIVGSYTLTYNVSDTAGNAATAVTRTVNVIVFPSLTIAAVSVLEGSGGGATNMNFTVTLSSASASAVTVGYTTTDGTALSASDYTATTATLTIPAGNNTGTITVLVGADTTFERNETLTLTLSNPVNATITTAAATGTILNDDVGGLNDTGITTWGNASVNNLTVTQALFPGQDADHGRDAQAAASTLVKTGGGKAGFDFTKLDAAGQPLANQAVAYTTTPWSCVQDHVTGLMWEVKTTTAGLHNTNKTYTWYNSTGINDGGNAGRACTGVGCTNDTEKYVAAVNAAGLCGFNDWRLPKKEALGSIVDLSVALPSPTIDTGYFPNTINSWYWSASPYAGDATNAWYVDFSSGGGGDFKSVSHYVRLVRGGQ